MSNYSSEDDSSLDSFMDVKKEDTPGVFWLKIKGDQHAHHEVIKALKRSKVEHKTLDNTAMAIRDLQAKKYIDILDRRRQLRQDPDYKAKRKAYYADPKVIQRRQEYAKREDVKARRREQAKKRRQLMNTLIKENPARALKLAEQYQLKLQPSTYVSGSSGVELPSKEPGKGPTSKKKENR